MKTIYRSFLPFFFIAVISSSLSGQQGKGVQFRSNYSIEKAIQVAQTEDKIIFVDTYTPWCGPCKLMDIQFQDPELGNYFNERFINVKINMDSEYGPTLKNKYHVFFLPTLLILDKYGNVQYASQGTLTSDELISYGKQFYQSIYEPELVQKVIVENVKENDPLKESKSLVLEDKSSIIDVEKKANDPDIPELGIEQGKILFTQNELSNNPEFLYNLTYLKLQLQDGTQWIAAEKYLTTQSDWSTEKNMKFIYDFARRPGTKMFDHILDHKEDYERLFGEESVRRSISIMINMRLYQGFPRPNEKEVLELYKILDEGVAEDATYSYLLERYEVEENFEAFIPLALEYLKYSNPDDFSIINKIVVYHEASSVKIKTNELINMMEHAIEVQGGTYYVLFNTMASLYYKKKKKKKALENIDKALALAKNSGVDLTRIYQLKEMILEL